MMHLGTRATALADGQLPARSTERALAHAAGCVRCARDLAEAGAARGILSAAPDVVPDGGLTTRLLAMSPPAPVAGRPSDVVRWEPGPWHLAGGPTRSPRTRAMFTVGAGGLFAVGLFALGSGPLVTPSLHPSDPLVVLGEADASVPHETEVVMADQGQALTWMGENGWRHPKTLPDGYAVDDVRLEGNVLELDIAGAEVSTTIVIREQGGRLDDKPLANVGTLRIGDRGVYVVSREPWHLLWQSGSTVIDVVSDAPEGDVVALVGAFPGGGYDSGIPARIRRGWTTVTGTIGRS